MKYYLIFLILVRHYILNCQNPLFSAPSLPYSPSPSPSSSSRCFQLSQVSPVAAGRAPAKKSTEARAAGQSIRAGRADGVRADHLVAAPHPDHNRRGGSLHHLPLAEWRHSIVLPGLIYCEHIMCQLTSISRISRASCTFFGGLCGVTSWA